jgi:hypothetical protein
MSVVEIAVQLLGIAAKLAPSLVTFYRNAIDVDPTSVLSQRVASILPAESESEKAERLLRLG